MPASGEYLVPVRDRATVVTSVILLLIAAAAWIDVVRSSLGVPDMMMTMFMPMTVTDGVAFVASWGIMMTAMMLPSALPMIGLYGATQRGAAAPGRRGVPIAVFAFVYLAVWAAFGAPVYVRRRWRRRSCFQEENGSPAPSGRRFCSSAWRSPCAPIS